MEKDRTTLLHRFTAQSAFKGLFVCVLACCPLCCLRWLRVPPAHKEKPQAARKLRPKETKPS